ncbi:rhomboid family intramembrane serine protease [Nocardiopsis trehalosi]|uniref:rhomboid family intramembrane serine protease n=1 Tax=Nocardiopsis trehalosi TaxID=109329 RepID=UPI0008302A08|nr:rhomboid family intramembrane serine protease [Nocardiopsis trehalosi]
MSASPPPRSGEPGAQAVPTCYRHPERETYVRCTRCDRPICPDCMREAPVGHQCVQCVAEGQKGVRRPRTVFGGRVARQPYVTYALLGLIVAGFLAQSVVPGLAGRYMMWGVGVINGQWDRLLTGAFLHGGLMHVAFNGFALWVVGRQVEDWLGHARYLALWLLSALGGSVLSLALVPDQASVGASGAVFGLFGAVFVIGRRLNLDTRFILGLLAVNLLITFLVPQISWTGHIGGLVTGLAVAAVYAYLPTGGRTGAAADRTRTLVHAGATLAAAVLLVGAAIGLVAYWTSG